MRCIRMMRKRRKQRGKTVYEKENSGNESTAFEERMETGTISWRAAGRSETGKETFYIGPESTWIYGTARKQRLRCSARRRSFKWLRTRWRWRLPGAAGTLGFCGSTRDMPTGSG